MRTFNPFMSPTVECAGTTPLTVSNLNLPEFQLKDIGRTELFVRVQRRFGTAARPGCPSNDHDESHSAVRSPDDNAGTEHKLTQGGGFSSPILKARVDRMPRGAATAKAKRQGLRDETNKPREQIILGSTKADGKVRTATVTNTSKKRQASPDSECVARLADRRDRKRANRAIMNPVAIRAESEEAGSNESERGGTKPNKSGNKTRKTKKKKNVKLDAALTLMQNFTATNVGKDRLTLKPGPNMGVFNKGKASVPIKTDHDKGKNKKDTTFSELKFLNNTGPPSNRYENDSSSSTRSDLQNELPKTNRSRFFTAGPPREVSKHKNRKRHTSHSEGPRSPEKTVVRRSEGIVDAPDDSRESEVWDIELDKPLPSEGGSEDDSASKAIVVLSTKTLGWDLKPECQTIDDQDPTDLPIYSPSFRPGTPDFLLPSDVLGAGARSPSLAPSNSASQQVATKVLTTSKKSAPDSLESVGFDQLSRSLNPSHHRSKPPKSLPFRFAPIRHLDTYEPSVSPAPDSSLFPPYLEHDPRNFYLQGFGQGGQEALSPSLEDPYPPSVFGDDPTDGYVMEEVGLQSQNFPKDDDYYYETVPGDIELSEEFLLQDAPLDEGRIFDQDYDQQPMSEGLNDETSEYQFREWDEGVATGACVSDWDVGPELEEAICMDPSHSICDDKSETSIPFSPSHSPGFQSRFPFTQGRSILLGVEEPNPREAINGNLGETEVEVARKLKNHWEPQRL